MRNIDYYRTVEIAQVAYNDYPNWPIEFEVWQVFEHVAEMPSIYGDDNTQYKTLTYDQAKVMAEAIPHEITWDDVKPEVFRKIREVMTSHESDTNDRTTWDNIKKEVSDIMNPIVADKLIYSFITECGDKTVFRDIVNEVKMMLRVAFKKTSESEFSYADFEMRY